jgi:brefeldin A-inhibited guanine nucleotide-exchange protein
MEAHEAVMSRRQTLNNTHTSSQNDVEADEVVADDVTPPSSPASAASMERKEQEANFATTFDSQYHADSYALFRSLCKLSSKELEAENESTELSGVGAFFSIQLASSSSQSDPMSLNGKILALNLILSAMDYSGRAFCEGERFIYLVQHYLCVSLLKNCVSNHTQVAFLSQKIFMVLLYKFKGHLKHEIEVFMSNVFLRVLESPNSSFKQKALVLESLRGLCQDPVILTQIFLNYDCDFEARNLYKEIVHILTKLGGKATSNPLASNMAKKDAEHEFELSLAGLEVLTHILRAFLKALGLPFEGSEDDSFSDTAGSRIRSMLQLDVGIASRADAVLQSSADSVLSDDSSLVSTSRHGSVSGKGGSGGDVPDAASTVQSNAEVAVKIADAFEQKRNVEQNFEIGAVKFTLSLKDGLKFFTSNGFVELDAREIAIFFLTHKDKLDKTQMGEALGREPDSAYAKGGNLEPDKGGPGFWFRILHHYVEALDFAGLPFDEAIRLFLSGFRLPGEAQKIDRIMEKFAERYTSQNPEVFPSADTAFILAFSVIMLNTDLHNPSIKPERRMTVESFIRNNRGIGADGGDLPDDFLVAIFNNIKDRPFSLKEDDVARERAGAQKPLFDASMLFETSVLFGDNAEEQRRERFKKERDEMMAATQQLVRRRADKKGKAASSGLAENVAPADVVKPMFDVAWGPMLGILSQVLECSDDERAVAVCLNGFGYAVRIAAHSEMTLARDTFVSSLAKFTFLGSIKEMKEKNLACIRTLLSIAVIDGEHLGESWGPVLQCISQIARLRLTASGLDTDDSFLLVEREKPKKPAPIPSRVELFRTQPSKSEIAREAEENNAQAVLEAVQEVLIDKVFSSTVSLSASSLAHFIEQLIAVSKSEIQGNSKSVITGVNSTKETDDIVSTIHSKSGTNGPSIFSLQKLVEVADFNMDVRPRLVWAQIWGKMSDFFAKIACDRNSRVNFFAIDSLKQLSSKFLEKPELSEFNFQRTFLNPFLVVMEDKDSKEETREMVLQCVDHIVQTKSRNLRSGWITIFMILRRSACDPGAKIESLGVSILQRLLDEHLSELCNLATGEDVVEMTEELSAAEKRQRNSNVDDFIGLCRASLSFVRQVESDSPRPIELSMRAFSHIAIYADLLADHRVLPPVSGAQVRSLLLRISLLTSVSIS